MYKVKAASFLRKTVSWYTNNFFVKLKMVLRLP